MTLTHEDVKKWFTYHPPMGDQIERYGKLRESARNIGFEILNFHNRKRSNPFPLQEAIEKHVDLIVELCPPSVFRTESVISMNNVFAYSNLSQIEPAMIQLLKSNMLANASIAIMESY